MAEAFKIADINSLSFLQICMLKQWFYLLAHEDHFDNNRFCSPLIRQSDEFLHFFAKFSKSLVDGAFLTKLAQHDGLCSLIHKLMCDYVFFLCGMINDIKYDFNESLQSHDSDDSRDSLERLNSHTEKVDFSKYVNISEIQDCLTDTCFNDPIFIVKLMSLRFTDLFGVGHKGASGFRFRYSFFGFFHNYLRTNHFSDLVNSLTPTQMSTFLDIFEFMFNIEMPCSNVWRKREDFCIRQPVDDDFANRTCCSGLESRAWTNKSDFPFPVLGKNTMAFYFMALLDRCKNLVSSCRERSATWVTLLKKINQAATHLQLKKGELQTLTDLYQYLEIANVLLKHDGPIATVAKKPQFVETFFDSLIAFHSAPLLCNQSCNFYKDMLKKVNAVIFSLLKLKQVTVSETLTSRLLETVCNSYAQDRRSFRIILFLIEKYPEYCRESLFTYRVFFTGFIKQIPVNQKSKINYRDIKDLIACLAFFHKAFSFPVEFSTKQNFVVDFPKHAVDLMKTLEHFVNGNMEICQVGNNDSFEKVPSLKLQLQLSAASLLSDLTKELPHKVNEEVVGNLRSLLDGIGNG